MMPIDISWEKGGSASDAYRRLWEKGGPASVPNDVSWEKGGSASDTYRPHSGEGRVSQQHL